MSALCQTSAPRRLMQTVVGFFGLLSLGVALPTRPAQAAAPRYSDIFPLRQVKPGMVGYGLTTFKGTTISRFEVTVVGILKKANAGRDLILVRMKGGPITERGANLIHGMSGSPIYFNGKVAGAFAYGEEFPKEPLGMVTPIEDMLDSWNPNIPQQPTYFQPAEKNAPRAASQGQKTSLNWRNGSGETVAALPQPIMLGGRRVSEIVLCARADDSRRSSESVAVMHRATTMLSVTGVSDIGRNWLQKELNRRGYSITVAQGPAIGAGRVAKFQGVPLRPGSAFGTFLSTGDVQVGSTGTVTYRRGNRILAFGHPMMGLGALEAAITSAYILDIFSGFETSHHIAVAGPIVGTLRQDRDFSVSADVGRKPEMVPFTITVHDETSQRTQTFHNEMFQHPDLTPILMRLIAREAVTRVHSVPGDVMARVSTTVEAAEVGKITRTNQLFDANDISSAALQDLGDITGITSGNPFYPLPIKSAKMDVDITAGHNTATVERIFLKQGRYEPGDTLDIGVVLKPYRRDPITKSISVKIPSDLPTGRYQLVVRGGTPNVVRFGSFVISSGSQDPQTPPVNVRQMVARLSEREANTDLVARLILNSVAPALEGEKLSQLPPNLSALMRSERNSGVRLERDEIKNLQPTEYVVSGAQQLVVSVVRKNTQEQPGGSSFGGPPPLNSPGGAPGSLPGGVPSINVSDDADVPTGDTSEAATEPENSATVAPESALPMLSGEAARWQAMLNGAEPPKPAETKPKEAPKRRGKNDKNDTSDAKKTDTPPAATTAPAPKADDSSSDKPVGRQMQVWRQSARTDFGPGKFAGTSVAANGELRLTPTLRRLASTPETYIWSLAADGKGNLYAGTGTSGKILKIDSEGKVTTFATLPVVTVQSLLFGKDGTLWAGSGVKGNLYKVASDGTFKLVRSLPEKYILALTQDSKGNLYIAPGGGGTVYELASDRKSNDPTPYLKTTADHIMSLAVDAKDNLYVGTGNDGTLYKVTPDGKSSVLYDAKENAITALVVDADGNVYAATGPKGLIYRISTEGVATVVFDRTSSFFTAMQPAPDGTFYAATVNAVYHILPSSDPTRINIQPLDNPKDVDFLSLAVTPEGSVYAGTGNIGEVYTSSGEASGKARLSGTYESVVHDAKLSSRWGMMRWNAQVPAGAQLRVETRTGNVAEPDSTWSAWSPAQPSPAGPSEGIATSPPARFIQYRVTLETNSEKAQPILREVSIGYLPRNQAPKVTFQSPGGGERWAKSQTIRWNGEDPDRDTLSYLLYYSTDAGATWKPLPGEAAKSADSSASAPTDGSAPATPGIAALEKQLQEDKSMPATLKQVLLDGAKRRQGTSGANLVPLREPSKSWDTKTLPDGTYWLKVIATDRGSNPAESLSAEAISEPFVICNAPPRISVSVRQVVPLDRTFALEGVASQSLIAMTAVQYRVDGGDWVAAIPKDGLFDTPREEFVIATAPLTSGKHTVEIKAFNAAGTSATEKLDVTVP